MLMRRLCVVAACIAAAAAAADPKIESDGDGNVVINLGENGRTMHVKNPDGTTISVDKMDAAVKQTNIDVAIMKQSIATTLVDVKRVADRAGRVEREVGIPSSSSGETDSGKVAWFEASPALMPRFSAEGSSRIVSVLGVGLSSKMFYNPKLKRQFECKFEAQGGSSSKLPSTRGTVVKSRDPMDAKDFFYDIACPVPEVNQAPADFKLSIMYKGKAMEFAGAASNAIFKVTSFVDKFKLTEGVLAVGGEGYQTKAKGGKYACIFKYVGGGSDVTVDATIIDTKSATCPVGSLKSSQRLLDVKVALFDKELKTNLDVAAGFSNALTVDTCADGVANNDETDVDCGGGSCPGCAPKQKCNSPKDCDAKDKLLCEAAKGLTQKICLVPDKDGDGQSEFDGDCNDADPSIYKGAPELYDGKDNDCDGRGKDGDYTGQLLSGSQTKNKWEFTEFKVTSGTARPMKIVNPIEVYSVKPALIAKGATMAFYGDAGQASLNAYSYRRSSGGPAGPGGKNYRGGIGPRNEGHSNCQSTFKGLGPGGGCGSSNAGYGPGGGGAGHAKDGTIGGYYSGGTRGSAGKAYGSLTKPELNPGSGGGGGGYGSARNQGGSAGGGAGGTLKITAPGIKIQGRIQVHGGRGGAQGRSSGDGGTGGGGSGGTVWLEALGQGKIEIDGGEVDTRGGDGGQRYFRGGIGGRGSDGKIWYNTAWSVTNGGKVYGWTKKY